MRFRANYHIFINTCGLFKCCSHLELIIWLNCPLSGKRQMAPLNIDRLLRREPVISAFQRHFQVNRNQKVTFLMHANDLIVHVLLVHNINYVIGIIL